MLTAEALGQPSARVLPFAAAVEFVHTYSLIHDDLPAMDNDDLRRGQPTNHRKFNEATAILAGDSLLTEAFQILGDGYAAEPDLAVAVIRELARAAGLHGMVGGQAIDMGAKKESISLEDLRLMHELKTGALIRVSAVGAAVLCRAGAERLREITLYAENLGLAFQVADDILDYDEKKIEPGSYPALLGLEKTQGFLRELTEKALNALSKWPASAEPLREIARYNGARSF
jgi:geranylgeranyl diphosphate synthase type II